MTLKEMTLDEPTAGTPRRCPDCSCGLERMAVGEWCMNRCPQCGGFWMDGDALHQMFLCLHMRHLDSERAAREVGALLLRSVHGATGPDAGTAAMRPAALAAAGSRRKSPQAEHYWKGGTP